MIKWSEISNTYKVLALIAASMAGLITWHYATFQTVSASEAYQTAMTNSVDDQTLVILKRELREYQRELASLPEDTPADDKLRVWLEDQIAELNDEIEKIEAKKRST